jgi:hypothetical protein
MATQCENHRPWCQQHVRRVRRRVAICAHVCVCVCVCVSVMAAAGAVVVFSKEAAVASLPPSRARYKAAGCRWAIDIRI